MKDDGLFVFPRRPVVSIMATDDALSATDLILQPVINKCWQLICQHYDQTRGQWRPMSLSYAMIKQCDRLGLALEDPISQMPKPVWRYVLPEYPTIYTSRIGDFDSFQQTPGDRL